MTAGQRLGLLGGTFDPIHLGHVGTALVARDALALDRVLLVPSRTPPHRAQQPLASGYHRFAMTAMAAATAEGLEASDAELLAPGPSYTADTLQRLHATGLRPSEIFFITGADAFAEIATWSRYPQVLDLANFVVVSRPGHDAPTIVGQLEEARRRSSGSPAGTRVHVIAASTPDVSSTDVRRRLRAGQSIAGLVPPAVERHILRHRLYIAGGAGLVAAPAADHLHGQD
jgi:nicotinate-nucleotide adenylyltransferase